ncbi:TetR/AcrR family transcriptional regulator [Actinomadura sp. 9N407]|uniref:TetR/AcrR family transcriptional regulator n=1 Tax=Actinomadura sp. 9N407 TaxID=3375154 RepID=UPI0037910864
MTTSRRSKRDDWLDAGLAILAGQGAPALTIERLTERLGLSKGSFYHHFGGMGGYKTALLAHIEDVCTTRLIDLAEQDTGAAPMAKLERLMDLVVSDVGHGPELEVAVRAWAQQDPEARALQERVDHARIDYLRTLWLALSDDPDEAGQVASLFYLITIGGAHVIPPVPGPELRGLFEFSMRLAGGGRTRSQRSSDDPRQQDPAH